MTSLWLAKEVIWNGLTIILNMSLPGISDAQVFWPNPLSLFSVPLYSFTDNKITNPPPLAILFSKSFFSPSDNSTLGFWVVQDWNLGELMLQRYV
jgi:hypothetical protein